MKKLLLLALAALPILSAGQTVPSYVPTNGLLGWWPFNGNANDESGNGNNGTVNGATLTNDRNGNLSNAYSFNAFNWGWGSGGDFIYIPYSSTFNSNHLTVSAWFLKDVNYITNQVNPSVVKRFEGGYNNPNGQTWGIYVNTATDSLGTFILPPNTTNNYSTYLGQMGPTVNVNQWTHVVLSFDGATMTTYMNGLKISSLPANGMQMNANGNSGISIGMSIQANGHWDPFNGFIDDIGIWSRALDSCEIKDLYYSSLGNCCAVNITAQPANQSLTIGNNAVFNVAASGVNATYQWQTDIGLGFQNLTNAGQYSGVNTATLTVSSITAMNTNQAFRCIVADGACSDTSNVAYIFNTTGIEQVNSQPQLMVAPNPAHDVLNVFVTDAKNKTLQLQDASGRVVRMYNVNGTQAQLSLEGIERGVYFLSIAGEKGLMKKVLVE